MDYYYAHSLSSKVLLADNLVIMVPIMVHLGICEAEWRVSLLEKGLNVIEGKSKVNNTYFLTTAGSKQFMQSPLINCFLINASKMLLA